MRQNRREIIPGARFWRRQRGDAGAFRQTYTAFRKGSRGAQAHPQWEGEAAMMPFWLQTSGAWVWDASWHAAVVVGVALFIRQVAGKKLPPAMHCALWSLVALRLILFIAPQGSWSLFGLLERINWPYHSQPLPQSPTAAADQS